MSVRGNNAIDSLCQKVGKRWDAIDSVQRAADAQRDKIANILSEHRLVPSDTSFVVFGSLARNEWTVNSDVDWTLLVDGQADPNHLKVTQSINNRFVLAKLQEPGPTQTFGGLAFSHEIIHQIGGEEDSNRNTTRRILLLLESSPVGNSEAYDRVIGAVINRYLDSDISFREQSGQNYKVPRFLLNDIVRYWRTMCVDYATKHRERQGDKWALKNTKLRMSRKLIFAAGLLTCFNCHLSPPVARTEHLFDIPDHLEPLILHLRSHVRLTPLEIVADAATAFATIETAIEIFDAYSQFLDLMNDGDKRAHLEKLKSAEAKSDRIFQDVRKISNQFQRGLTKLFFSENAKLGELTTKYGLF
jgi:predicted nucleotidyltransferase